MTDRFEIDCHFLIIDDIIKVARTTLNVLHPQRCICIFHFSLINIKGSTENVVELIEAKSALSSRLSGTEQVSQNARLKKDARSNSRELNPFSYTLTC